jgi:glycerophosphoryl diester phosphodiesterase
VRDAVALLVAALALGGLAAVAEGFPPASAPRLAVAAHRGGALLWPENSRLAFVNALGLGVEYLELDVHRSRDGETVVIHDATLDRTTTGTGPVRDRTLAELRALRLRDRDGTVTAETVPTLDEVVALAASAGRELLVEIKVDSGRNRYPGIEEHVIATLDRHAMARAAVVMAFEPATWLRLLELRPSLRVGALVSARGLELMGGTLPVAIDAAARAGVTFIGLDRTLVTTAAVTQTRHAGVALGVWTVNEPADMRRAIALGVAVVISDRPDLVREMLRR